MKDAVGAAAWNLLRISVVLICAALAGPLSLSAADLTPDAAINKLKEGNTRYTSGKPSHPREDEARRGAVSAGQKPFATVLTCSDSRVPPEIFFDQGIGDIFVVRVAGNVADTDEIGTIEYGAGHLHTPIIVVLGHTKCGAVTAMVQGAKVGGSLPQLLDNIAPAVEQAKAENPGAGQDKLVSAAIEANIWQAIEDLLSRSEEVAELVLENKVKLVGALYDLEKGTVEWLGEHPSQCKLLLKQVAGHKAKHAEPAAASAHEEH